MLAWTGHASRARWEPALGTQTRRPSRPSLCGSGEKTGGDVSTQLHACSAAGSPRSPAGRERLPVHHPGHAPLLTLNLSKIQLTDSLSGAHVLYKVRCAFVPEEPGKGLAVPEAAAGAHGELRLKHLSLRVTIAHHRAVCLSTCPTAHVLRSCDLFSEHTLEFDRFSCWPASQLKPSAIWSMIKQVRVYSKAAVCE